MRTTFIAALLPNATAKVQKNLHICKKKGTIYELTLQRETRRII